MLEASVNHAFGKAVMAVFRVDRSRQPARKHWRPARRSRRGFVG